MPLTRGIQMHTLSPRGVCRLQQWGGGGVRTWSACCGHYASIRTEIQAIIFVEAFCKGPRHTPHISNVKGGEVQDTCVGLMHVRRRVVVVVGQLGSALLETFGGGGGISYEDYFGGGNFGGGGISAPLQIPKLTLPHAHTALPKPPDFAGKIFAIFLNDEIFPRNYPPPPPAVLCCPAADCRGQPSKPMLDQQP